MGKKIAALLAVLAVLGAAFWYVSTTHEPPGAVALFDACKKGDLEKVRQLLDQGVDINVQRAQPQKDIWMGVTPDLDVGFTPLMYAIEYRQPPVVDLLLEKGADIEKRTVIGNTALMMAANQVSMELVEKLLAKGADATAKNKWGHTAIDFASKRLMTEIHHKMVARLKKAGGFSGKEAAAPPRQGGPPRNRG